MRFNERITKVPEPSKDTEKIFEDFAKRVKSVHRYQSIKRFNLHYGSRTLCNYYSIKKEATEATSFFPNHVCYINKNSSCVNNFF
jgi:hypothetical protein